MEARWSPAATIVLQIPMRLSFQWRELTGSYRDLTSRLTGRMVTSVKTLRWLRSEEHTSELQSLMRISYAVFCLKKKTKKSRALQNENPPTKAKVQHTYRRK